MVFGCCVVAFVTDASGISRATITLHANFPGNYSFIGLLIGSTATTRLMTASVQVPSIAQLLIVTQPSTGPGPALVGNLLAVQPTVRVVDAAGAGVPGVSLTAFFVNDDCSPAPAMADISSPLTLGLGTVYGLPISEPADATGTAAFHSIAFMDALTGCYRLMFVAVVGTSPVLSIKHALSAPLCVVNVDKLAVVGQPSKVTSAGAAFGEPFTVSLTRPYRSDLMDVRACHIQFWCVYLN